MRKGRKEGGAMGSHHTKQYGRRPSTAPLISLVPGTSPPVLQGSIPRRNLFNNNGQRVVGVYEATETKERLAINGFPSMSVCHSFRSAICVDLHYDLLSTWATLTQVRCLMPHIYTLLNGPIDADTGIRNVCHTRCKRATCPRT